MDYDELHEDRRPSMIKLKFTSVKAKVKKVHVRARTVKEFAGDCSIAGISHAFTSNCKWISSFWILVMAGMTALSVKDTVEIVGKLGQREKILVTSVSFEKFVSSKKLKTIFRFSMCRSKQGPYHFRQ